MSAEVYDDSDVPDDAREDIPPPGEREAERNLVPEQDPECDHRRGMDRIKLRFARRLITGCVSAVIVLSGIQFFFQNQYENTAVLTSAIDVMKLLATTALGFVFGRTLDKSDS